MNFRALSLLIFQSTLPARGATGFDKPHMRYTCLFQSTLPARGATVLTFAEAIMQNHFNPRSPHGERPDFNAILPQQLRISIHAPRTGSDTISVKNTAGVDIISIHAPRTGSDSTRTTTA